MIQYKTGIFGVCFVFQVKGSVFPKAFVWGIPNALICYFIHRYLRDTLWEMEGFDAMWSGYTFVLGFLIVFRNSHGYARFWESATLIQQMRGEWMNAISSTIAFCAQSEDKKIAVKQFQHLLVRLMSMLHCQALQQVCDLNDDSFEIIDIKGLDPNSLAFLSRCDDRCEVILQWIQRAILDAQTAGTINIAPPILSRAFQELSRGMVNLNNVRKIKEIPFPFPYAQMIQAMLMFHTVVTPVLASHLVANVWCASALCFLITTSFWSLLYIAREIDHPFGEDLNDFNVSEMQHAVNQSLLTLLHPLAQKAPTVTHEHQLSLVSSDQHITGGGQRDSGQDAVDKSITYAVAGVSNVAALSRDVVHSAMAGQGRTSNAPPEQESHLEHSHSHRGSQSALAALQGGDEGEPGNCRELARAEPSTPRVVRKKTPAPRGVLSGVFGSRRKEEGDGAGSQPLPQEGGGGTGGAAAGKLSGVWI